MKRKLICVVVFICLSTFWFKSSAQLSGTYLIGPNAPVYKTISQAVHALDSCQGVKAAVTFNIENGVYNEQVFIPIISGSSLNNLVTFQSLSGDSSKVIIKFKPKNDTFNYTLKLDGSWFLVFKKITFATDTISGRVIDINNGCLINQFLNNRIIGMPGSKELIYSEGTSLSIDNNNRFENNLFLYGSVGISFSGFDATAYEEGNEILKNSFVNQSQQAIDIKFCKTFKLNSNSISTSMGLSEYTGIRVQFCQDKFYIDKNKLDINNQTMPSQGISIILSDGISLSTASSISNNFIHIATNGIVYNSGIEIRRSSFKNINFNSVNITGNNSVSIGFNDIMASNINIFNNIFSNPANGMALLLNDTTDIFCDYNVLYSKGNFVVSDGTNNYPTLSAWSSFSKRDLHSISTDPIFLGNADLHCKNFRLSKRGKSISGFTDDIDGNKRKSPKPDIGADEFNYKLDLGLDRYICAGSSTSFLAEKGFDTYLWSNGSNNDSISVDSVGTGLATKKIKLSVSYQTDNYSDSVLVHFIKAQAILGVNRSVCENEKVILLAKGGVKYKWNTGDTIATTEFAASKSSFVSVTVTDQYGCVDSASIWVNVKPRPAKPSIIQVGFDSLRSSVIGTTYRWYVFNSLIPDNSICIKTIANGPYRLIVYDSACYSDSSETFNFEKNSIAPVDFKPQLKLYPNPVTNKLFVDVSELNHSCSEIQITSTMGKIKYYSEHNQAITVIETSGYEKGFYILKFKTREQTITKSFVVQ